MIALLMARYVIADVECMSVYHIVRGLKMIIISVQNSVRIHLKLKL